MTKYRTKSTTVNATQWTRIGDHPAVVTVPSGHPSWQQPQQAERCGWIDGQFVNPGVWIVEDGGKRFVVDAFTFSQEYEPDCTGLPDIEIVSAKVHEAWMDSKRAQGVTTRKSESDEELMVAYENLSEAAKELDRGTVKAVYAAIESANR
jgi:hypothetical protein